MMITLVPQLKDISTAPRHIYISSNPWTLRSVCGAGGLSGLGDGTVFVFVLGPQALGLPSPPHASPETPVPPPPFLSLPLGVFLLSARGLLLPLPPELGGQRDGLTQEEALLLRV